MSIQLQNHDFDSFFVYCAPHVNEDGELARCWTTPRVKNVCTLNVPLCSYLT